MLRTVGLVHYPFEPAGPFMCVPACINMILGRRGFKTFTQEEIAKALGLVVPPSLASQYPWASVSDDEALWGVHPQVETTSLNRFFQLHGIPLSEVFWPGSRLSPVEYRQFATAQLALGNDIVVGYDFRTVFGSGRHRGHVSLVCGAHHESDSLWLVDPDSPTLLLAPVASLALGIWVRRDGFWVISQNPHMSSRSTP
jgi:hypothetical protein